MTEFLKDKMTTKVVATIAVIIFALIWPLEDALSAESAKQIPPDRPPKYNRLIHESSPYLLQHADNPVDWYPWGEEAFETARMEDKPIFLSIGHSQLMV
jgi:hypothetical protein